MSDRDEPEFDEDRPYDDDSPGSNRDDAPEINVILEGIGLPDRIVTALEAIAANIGTIGNDVSPIPPPQVRLTHSLFTELRFGLGSVAFGRPATQVLASKISDGRITYTTKDLPPESQSLSVIYSDRPPFLQDIDAKNPIQYVMVSSSEHQHPLAVMFFDKQKCDSTKAAILVSFVTR